MAIEVSGKKVVITGALSKLTRSQATEELEALGALVTKAVTKETLASPEAAAACFDKIVESLVAAGYKKA